MAGNSNLHKANVAKKDEFYTQLVDIELELKHYRKHFKNEVVFCSCNICQHSLLNNTTYIL